MKLLRLVTLVAIMAGFSVIQGQAATIVAPNANAASFGNTNNLIPFSAGRFGIGSSVEYQQVYAASQFGPSGTPFDIGSIAFRLASGDAPGPDTDGYGSFQVELSETSAAPNALSSTFANNLGADNTVVYSGPLTVTGVGGQNPNPFSVIIPLQTAFHYDNSLGNLLLDIQLSNPNQPNGLGFMPTLDAVEGSPYTSRVYTSGSGSLSATGRADDIALVTQFNSPVAAAAEPSSFVLLAMGLAALGLLLRKRNFAVPR